MIKIAKMSMYLQGIAWMILAVVCGVNFNLTMPYKWVLVLGCSLTMLSLVIIGLNGLTQYWTDSHEELLEEKAKYREARLELEDQIRKIGKHEALKLINAPAP